MNAFYRLFSVAIAPITACYLAITPVNGLAQEQKTANLQVHIDPTTGAFLQEAPTPIPTAAAQARSSDKTANTETAQSEDTVEQTPTYEVVESDAGRGRMVNIQGMFTAQFSIQKHPHSGEFNGNCEILGHQH